jgi:hypothetical protein
MCEFDGAKVLFGAGREKKKCHLFHHPMVKIVVLE